MVSTYGMYQSQNECFARPRVHLDYLSLKDPSIKIHSNWRVNAWRRITMEFQLFAVLCCAKSLQSCLTLRLHGLWPSRLLCSWNSRGMNTGVVCHFLLDYLSLKGPSIKIHSNWWVNAWRRTPIEFQLFVNFKWCLWQLLNDYLFNPNFVKILCVDIFYVCRYLKTCMCVNRAPLSVSP